MFLSLLHVNTANRPGRQWMGSLYRVHQRLWMAFPSEKARAEDEFFLGPWSGSAVAEPKPQRNEAGFLFRIERDGPARILVQSAQQPDWGYAFQNAPHLLMEAPRIRQFEPAPQNGQVYRFRLLAHVADSRRVARDDRPLRTTRSGKEIQRRRRTEVVIHPGPAPDPLPLDTVLRAQAIHARWEPWREWLRTLGSTRGFVPLDEPRCPLLMQAVHAVVRNPDWQKPRRYNAGLFEGVLRCTNADDLRAAIINGIGHAKAFGFGLLSIVPADPPGH